MYLGAFGADVVKVESIQRPDGFRFVGAFPEDGADFYDRSGIWQGTNLDKRGITLDAGRPEGRDLLRALVAGADVVVENFSARVVEHLGLDHDTLRELNPGLVMVRMPGFGLEGPWRDYVGWAMGIEQAAGMAQVTGFPGLPMHPGGFADPMISMHMGVAVQAALEHRDRTGEGQLIEVAQLEAAACLTADQVIDFDLNGRLAARTGNRTGARESTASPQGVFATRDREWVAVSVRDDADWAGLLEALGRPLWATDEFAGAAARLADVDHLETMLAESFATQDAGAVVERLVDRGVPAARVLRPAAMYDDPQLAAREFYVPIDHPLTGVRRYPAWPMRFSFAEFPHRFGAPTLGGDNAEVLAELGVDPATLADLEAAGIVGTRMVGT